MNSLKPISISLSPNTEKDDIALAFKLLFRPNKWKKGKEIELLEGKFKEYLGLEYAFSFNSGRSALMAILNALPLMPGDEILLQAFTCNASANPILWSGFKPVFVDCDKKTFNLDPEDLKRKITSRSRAVMVQHTFGLPANLNEILAICRQRNLLLIEDCAHSLGAEYQEQKVGTFGQVAFFSFSRDKIISSVYGGMAVTNDDRLAEKMRLFQQKVGYPSMFWIGQQLLHPVLMNWLVLPTYRLLGKYFLVLFQRLKVLSKAVHWKEKRGLKPNYFPKRLPRALAFLALNQFKKIDKFNSYRQDLAKFYAAELAGTKYELPEIAKGNVFLRFSIKHILAHKIIRKAWQDNLLLGDWYTTPIAPHDTKLEKIGYKMGSCLQAEKLAGLVLNLPTHINISMAEAHKVVEFLKKHGD